MSCPGAHTTERSGGLRTAGLCLRKPPGPERGQGRRVPGAAMPAQERAGRLGRARGRRRTGASAAAPPLLTRLRRYPAARPRPGGREPASLRAAAAGPRPGGREPVSLRAAAAGPRPGAGGPGVPSGRGRVESPPAMSLPPRPRRPVLKAAAAGAAPARALTVCPHRDGLDVPAVPAEVPVLRHPLPHAAAAAASAAHCADAGKCLRGAGGAQSPPARPCHPTGAHPLPGSGQWCPKGASPEPLSRPAAQGPCRSPSLPAIPQPPVQRWPRGPPSPQHLLCT